MKIAEVFYSIQGEGKLMGVPSAFVRASGCNLRCTWCDTPYASWNPEGRERTIADIVAEVQSLRAKHVVVTGGEPMIMPDIEDLCRELKHAGLHITIETAATVYKPVHVDLASLSPKLSNSTPVQRDAGRFAAAHEKHRLNIPVIRQFIDSAADYQLKFVISREEDLAEIHAILKELRGVTKESVLLMPEGTDHVALADRALWVVELCKKEGFRYCPRLHIELWGNRRGT